MRALVLSGGASKGAFTAGVVRYLIRDKQMDFDIAIGTSTGALVGGPALLGDYNYLSNIYTNMHNSDIYKNSLVYWLLNQIKDIGPVDASMEPLHKLLRRYYLNRGKLQELVQSGKQFVATTVNVRTGDVVCVSTDQVKDGSIKNEKTFVKAIVASCSEPVFTEPIQIFQSEPDSAMKDDLFYDGGVREFLPFEHAVRLGADEIWAISTHPMRTEDTEWGDQTSPDKVSIFKALSWTLGAILNEVERGDLFRAYAYYRLDWVKKNVKSITDGLSLSDSDTTRLLNACDAMFPQKMSFPKLYVITPSEPLPTSLEFDPSVMENYLADGILAAEKFFTDGQPEFADSGAWLLS